MQAMILAAGFGTRLLPHTKLRPKPLFPLLNQPLLLLTIDHLKSLGFTRIVVNCHYLADQIVTAVANRDIIVQREEVLLGTGGGLRKAMAHFSKEPVLVTNGDIYHTIDLIQLYQQHQRDKSHITLAMHDYPQFNTVFCQEGKVADFAPGRGRALAYTGVQVLNPEILNGISPTKYSCIISHYKELLQQGVSIRSVRVDQRNDFFWTDMGTPEAYLKLHGDLLKNRIPCWPELKKPQTPILSTENQKFNNVKLSEWVVIGKGVELGYGCTICRSVLWENVKLPAKTKAVNTIVSGADNE